MLSIESISISCVSFGREVVAFHTIESSSVHESQMYGSQGRAKNQLTMLILFVNLSGYTFRYAMHFQKDSKG